jgi:hypothetical protein
MFPDSILQIAKEAAQRHGDDVGSAVDEALGLIKATPEYESIIDKMVRVAVADMVYKARHDSNKIIKKKAGEYGTEQKVKSGSTKAIQESYGSVYNYYLGGRTLGNLMGSDLDKIAKAEEAVAEGHMFNVRLCRRLSALVPKDKLVREVVGEKKLRVLFQELGNESAVA